MSNSDERINYDLVLKGASELTKIIGDNKVVTDKDILEKYSKDESSAEPNFPDVLVRANDVKDISETIKIASKYGIPVTPRAAGTGKSGGCIPVRGGFVLATEKMNKILEINKNNLSAIVEPGVILGEFQKSVEAEGLFYPPDPQSLETCALGGNVAENSGGPRAFKYGVTGHYVLGIEATMANGETIFFGRNTIKWVAGYNLVSLLVGSEGTLGIFSKIYLRLLPLPPHIVTVLFFFRSEIEATTTVNKLLEERFVPTVMEFMDSTCITEVTKSGVDIPQGSGAMLIVEQECGQNDDEPVEKIIEIGKKYALDIQIAMPHTSHREKLWAARRKLSDTLKQNFKLKMSEDIVVPRQYLPQMMQKNSEIAKKWGIKVASYGHIGDGNLHVNVLSQDPSKKNDIEQALEDVLKAAIELDGTISGEHGIGCTKKNYLPWEQGQNLIQLQRNIKSLFDPHNILNPGKIFI